MVKKWKPYLTARSALCTALCYCTMALHYLIALSAYMTTLCAFSRHYLTELCTVCTPGPSHQACRTVFRVPSYEYEQFSSESRCEKHSVYPRQRSVYPHLYQNRLQSAGVHLWYGKLSSRRLTPRAADRMSNGLSKINSLTSFAIRILLLFYEMQLLPGMP